MAEQTSHDVVNHTLSGGEHSPSDVPASTTDNKSAGGDEGEINNTATTLTDTKSKMQLENQNGGASEPYLENSEKEKYTEHILSDSSKHGPGSVATRVLEMNGVASASDGGEDTASQGGSESDASRTESRLLGRAGSTKRPTSFKPVSFAKFSVPKAPGTPPVTKSPEKTPLSSSATLSTALQNSRPRLVAKTTSSLRDSISKLGANAAKVGGGPDPNQVWNKNRPVQQTPPKHLTDEELKQQYGIHMTSRIQEDGGGTEAKWADIDDDEDDWAPETIEWTDGTKTDLTQQPDPVLAPVQDTKPVIETKEDFPPVDQVAIMKDTAKSIPKPITSIGPNPTVLRLGASAERQARSASMSLKGAHDKTPSSSTSPAPLPAKSPWAPLPPVERVSPVMPPVQVQPQPRGHSREQPINDGINGPPPPKEIAADDFNRSWREMQSGTRELYNSRSGRYEPVQEPRKGTWRGEQTFRTPAVLQRPSGQSEPVGPAEPSPAFQTHRSSGGQDGMHWTRRRTSSNVSGGSGSFGRRMSIGRLDTAQRSFEGRRGSQVNGLVEPSVHPRESQSKDMRDISSAQRAPSQPWPARGVANGPEKATHMPGGALPPGPVADEPGPPPQPPQEDPVAMQERIMKEKRMEARQRRLEQEEKEEAAKRERIKLKLEALGPPPEKPKVKSSESPESSKAEPHTPSAAPPSQSPPKPPVPEPTGEPKQYGMMKVHHPDNVKKLERERAADKSAPAANVRRGPSPAREPKSDAPAVNGLHQSSEHPTQVNDKFVDQSLDEPDPQWRGNLNVPNTYSPWTANSKLVAAPSTSLTNPWKPLSNDKTLGNGIFDQGLGGFPPRDLALRNHLALDQASIPAAGSQPFPGSTRSPRESTTISPLPSPEARHASYDSLSPIARPGPIGPPSSQHSHWQHDNRVAPTAAWNNFHAVASKREAEENEKLRNEMNTGRDGQGPLPVTFHETWRRVRTGDQAGERQVVSIARSTDSNAPIQNPLSSLDHPVGNLPFAESHARPHSGVPIRSSRFFPQATENKKPAFEEGDYFRSPSPPPPEEVSNHPVYTGDSNRPLVHLPAPKPIVKLPPKVVAPPPPPPTFASMVATPRPQPVSTATSWQEKINTLFGKKTVLEKKNALAVTSASKEPLDVQLHIAAVSVSLPYYSDNHIGDGEITAKQVEEAEEMFEDREVGSLPVVRVPTMAPAAAWQAAPPPSQSRQRGKNLKAMQVQSSEPISFGFYDKDAAGAVTRISIRLPGAIVTKTLTIPRKANSQTGSHTNSRPRGPSTYKPRKGTKPREGSSGSTFKKSASSSQSNGSSSPRRPSKNASWGPRSMSGSQ